VLEFSSQLVTLNTVVTYRYLIHTTLSSNILLLLFFFFFLPPFFLKTHRSWNERPYNDTYLKALRVTLDNAGFPNTMIVAPDSGWSIANDILADPVLAASIHAIGCHYPGTHSSAQAEQTMKPLWASEDDSTYDNNGESIHCFSNPKSVKAHFLTFVFFFFSLLSLSWR
jgi:hypothetical protein